MIVDSHPSIGLPVDIAAVETKLPAVQVPNGYRRREGGFDGQVKTITGIKLSLNPARPQFLDLPAASFRGLNDRQSISARENVSFSSRLSFLISRTGSSGRIHPITRNPAVIITSRIVFASHGNFFLRALHRNRGWPVILNHANNHGIRSIFDNQLLAPSTHRTPHPPPAHIAHRVDRALASSQFKMELRPAHAARFADL